MKNLIIKPYFDRVYFSSTPKKIEGFITTFPTISSVATLNYSPIGKRKVSEKYEGVVVSSTAYLELNLSGLYRYYYSEEKRENERFLLFTKYLSNEKTYVVKILLRCYKFNIRVPYESIVIQRKDLENNFNQWIMWLNFSVKFFVRNQLFKYRNRFLPISGVSVVFTPVSKSPLSNSFKIDPANFIQKRKMHTRSSVYSDLNYFLKSNSINVESQIKIERYLYNHAIISQEDSQKINGIYQGLYSKRASEFLINYKEKLLSKVQNFLKNKDDFQKGIKDSKKNIYNMYLIDIIETISPSFVIAVLLGRFIRILSNAKFNLTYERNLVIDIALDVSNDIIREYFRKKALKYKETLLKEDKIEKLSDYSFSDWKRDHQSFVDKLELSETKVIMGIILIEWLEDCDLVTRKLVKLETNQYNVFIPDFKLIDNFRSHISSELQTPSEAALNLIKDHSVLQSAPFRLPTIIKPKPFVQLPNGKIKLGGYYLNDEDYSDELILPNYALKDQSTISHNNIIYNVLNNLNSVGYCVNTNLLMFINQNPQLFEEELISEYIEVSSKASKKEKVAAQKQNSKYELQNHIISIAEILTNVNEFFFVNRLDNRGRLYCICEFFNYQSTELAKALLLFSRSTKVSRFNETTILYFKSYGVNCFGNKKDKLSLISKEKWINENTDNIINYENGILIKQAEHKFLFTAFCIEFKRFYDFLHNSEAIDFSTKLPIQLDATCNGFQHLVMLTGEFELAKHLNLHPMTFDDKPYDFYSYILEIYLDYINSDKFTQKAKEAELESYNRIKEFCLDRTLIKKVIMTIPYNATSKKMVDDLTNHLKVDYINGVAWFSHPSDLDSTKKLNYKDLYLLVSSLKGHIDSIAPKVFGLRRYLEEIAKICTKLETHITWSLPNGLEVRQSYMKEKTVNIKPFSYSSSKISLSQYTDKLDLNKQSRAFMPNLIHSLDAASLMLLVKKYFNNDEFNIKNIYTIHDCFAMPLGHIEFIIDSLRKIYISLYSENSYLEKLDNNILENIKLQYRDVTLEKGVLIIDTGINTLTFRWPNIKEVIGKELKLNYNTPYLII